MAFAALGEVGHEDVRKFKALRLSNTQHNILLVAEPLLKHFHFFLVSQKYDTIDPLKQRQ